MYAVRETVAITTDALGAATEYTAVVTGRLWTIKYTKAIGFPFANGVDFDITTESTGQELWVQLDVNASTAVCPRQARHDAAGAASLYAALGEAVEGHIPIAAERVKIVIRNGGTNTTGTFDIIVG